MYRIMWFRTTPMTIAIALLLAGCSCGKKGVKSEPAAKPFVHVTPAVGATFFLYESTRLGDSFEFKYTAMRIGPTSSGTPRVATWLLAHRDELETAWRVGDLQILGGSSLSWHNPDGAIDHYMLYTIRPSDEDIGKPKAGRTWIPHFKQDDIESLHAIFEECGTRVDETLPIKDCLEQPGSGTEPARER